MDERDEKKECSQEGVERRAQKANLAVPDVLVQDYDGLLEGLILSDTKDRNVLAAATKTNADVIVTNNLKDFPEAYLESFGLSVKSADDFLTDIIDLNSQTAVHAFRKMVLHEKF